MYYVPYVYQYPYYVNAPMYNYGRQVYGWPYFVNRLWTRTVCRISMKQRSNTYRTALWTGTHLQVTLMSLNVGEDVGLEMHPDVDQFLLIEQDKAKICRNSNECI